MLRNASIALLGAVVLTISACGSDGSKSDSQPVVTIDPLSLDPSTLTAEKLKQDYSNFADSVYSGKTTAAEISPDLVQDVAKTVFGFTPLQGPYLGDAIWTLAYRTGSIDRIVRCDYDGIVFVVGELGSDGYGNLALEFEGCQFSEYGPEISGKGVVTINSRDTESGIVYFNEVSVRISNSDDEREFRVSGYYEFSDDGESLIEEQSQYLVYTPVVEEVGEAETEAETDTEQVFSQWSKVRNYMDYPDDGYSPGERTVTGRVYMADTGFLDIETVEALTSFWSPDAGRLEFTGASEIKAALDFADYDVVRYLEDTDGDDEFDRGAYIASYRDYLFAESVSLTLVSIDSMSFPPEAYGLYFVSYSRTTLDDIEASSGSYYDRDTPDNELTVSYEWSINDVLVPGITGNVFPAGTAVFGDELGVRLVVSDGVNVTTSYERSISIGDAPAIAQISDFEGSLKVGDSLDLSVTFVDPDNIEAAIPASLAFGPSGMTIDGSGNIRWTSDQALFEISTVTFGVRDSTDAEAAIIELSVEVSDSSAINTIARSGVNTPTKNHSMIVGDFIGDSDQEVFVTDNDSRISLLANQGDIYKQIWLYPYALPTAGAIVQLLAYQLDDDEKTEMIAVTEKGISAIYSTTESAVSLWSTENNIIASAIFDANGNGIPEIAIIHSRSQRSGARTLEVIELTTPVSIVFETTLGYVTRDISIGNVDADDALELVTNDGFVYDTLSWENEWFFGSGFGSDFVTVGDYNADGIDEIAAVSASDGVYVYSAISKTLIDSFSQSSICSLGSANIDADSADELVVTSCRSYGGPTAAYSLIENALVSEWELVANNNSSRSLAFGDSDNDGVVEIHWADSSSYNSRGSFVVASTESESEVKYRNNVTEQFYNLSAAGWGELSPGIERAVFITPATNNGRGDQHLIYMDEDGNYSVSAELGSTSNGLYGEVVDFNGDGYAEVFLATGSRYSEGFSAIQLNDLSVHWEASSDFSINVSKITSADINDDGFIDAIYVDGNTIRIVDVENQALLGSFTMGSTILDVAVNAEGESPVIAVSDSSSLSIWQKTGTSYTQIATVSQSCKRLNFGNVDSDAELELVCLSGNYSYRSSVITYEFNGETLTESNSVSLEQNATDFVFDTSQPNNQTLLVAQRRENNNSHSEIVSVSPLGERVIWTGPGLIGRVTHRSMHFRTVEEGSDSARLMFATDKAMYLVK